MKKSLIALAVAGISVSANAQSSVTLAGLVDQAYFSVNNESRDGTVRTRQNAFGEGSWAGSRIRISGSEKLGGGLTGIFWLEQGIAPSDGNGFNYRNGGNGPQFTNGTGMTQQNRQSYVGLAGGFGQVRLGRIYTAGYDLWTNNGHINGEFTGTVNASGAITARTRGVGYISPRMGGVDAYITYGANNNDVFDVDSTANQVNGRKDSESKLMTGFLRYRAGPIVAGAIYESEKASCTAATDNVNNFFGVAVTPSKCYVGGISSKFSGLLGEYDFKVAKVGVILGDKSIQSLSDGVTTDTRWNQINVKVPFGKQWEGRVTYNTLKSDSKGATTSDMKGQFFNVNYKLSNRTVVYASTGSMKDSAVAATALTGKETRSAIGVMHSF